MVDYAAILACLDRGMDDFNNANLFSFTSNGTPIYNAEAMDIAWENDRYAPTVGRPYQEIFLLPAASDQPANGPDATSFESGIYQVGVWFPRDEGAGAAIGRADLLRRYFTRSRLLTFNGITVRVERTPSISPPSISADWYTRFVSVPYSIYH